MRRWLGAFAAGGRPAVADGAYLAALERAADTAPPALGLPFDVWTSPRLATYLAEQTGARIAPHELTSAYLAHA